MYEKTANENNSNKEAKRNNNNKTTKQSYLLNTAHLSRSNR